MAVRRFKLSRRRARKNWSKREFIAFLRGTLIPDLRTSGMVSTAKDFVTAVKYMIRPTSGTPRFVSFLKETLIPDLKDSGYDATAEDFETAVRFMEAGMHTARSRRNTFPTFNRRKIRRTRRNPASVDVAWTGKRASYVSPRGNYGATGYSELAMHTGGAGKEVVRFALWKRPAKGYSGPANAVNWAQVEYASGTVLDGLPSEVLPGKVRDIIGYGSPRLPNRKQKLQLWALGKGVQPNKRRLKLRRKLGRKSARRNPVTASNPIWKAGNAVHKFMSYLDNVQLRIWRDVPLGSVLRGGVEFAGAFKSSVMSVQDRADKFANALRAIPGIRAYRTLLETPLRAVAGSFGLMEMLRTDF